jgi:hypothetical protein
MPIGAFALRFNNARLEKLTNRVMCLAGIALVLLFMRRGKMCTRNYKDVKGIDNYFWGCVQLNLFSNIFK